MTARRRLVLFLSLCILTIILLVVRRGSITPSPRIWPPSSPQTDQIGGVKEIKDETDNEIENDNEEDEQRDKSPPPPPPRIMPDPNMIPSALNATIVSSEVSRFSPGTTRPAGSSYIKAVVMGRLLLENTSWLDTAEFHDTVLKYIYNVDPSTSPSLKYNEDLLQLPKPKGHEAMVYLTYIIDHYSNLPDIVIFMHAHQIAWHNNELLNHDAVEMINRLSAERVIREGYMNLRCHWAPGCPAYIHPKTTVRDPEKLEEAAMKEAWQALFLNDTLPDVIAQPCCAQFAVSRERIQATPLTRYKAYREWLLTTPLSDYVSGRVFEYLWQKIFAGHAVVCPNMRVCYCDGYGVCFEEEKDFDFWFELKYKKGVAERMLDEWERMVAELERVKDTMGLEFGKKGLRALEELNLRVPAVDADVFLKREIKEYSNLLEEKRLKALDAGRDPRVRAKVAGRHWSGGDGF